MADVDRLGIGKVMEQCCDYMRGKNIHLSFDIDGIDPFFAPHTGTAAHGGLTFREGAFICEELYASGNLTSMELVEVDPERHPDVDATKTINTALTLIAGAMGRQIL
jgi:arginase